MAAHIHKCSKCQKYSIEKICPSCNIPISIPRPPKFSLEDKYASLKREEKKKELAKRKLY